MNNQTGNLACMHPLFDHNNAFDQAFMDDQEGGICQLLPGKSQRQAALYAVKHCDFRCIKPVQKSMFFDEKMYRTFMERACELGLYRKQKVSLLDKVFDPDKQEYIPEEIKDDNTKEYWDKARSLLKRETEPNISETSSIGKI